MGEKKLHEVKCGLWTLKHWLQGLTTKTYFGAVKLADLELTGNDCVSHSPAGCSALLAQAGADTLSLFPTKEHWLLSPNLQDVFLSLLHVDLDITRSLQETAEAFLRVIDSPILAGCISTIRQGKWLSVAGCTVSRSSQVYWLSITVSLFSLISSPLFL